MNAFDPFRRRRPPRSPQPMSVSGLSLLRIEPLEPVVYTPRDVKLPIAWIDRAGLDVWDIAEIVETIESLG